MAKNERVITVDDAQLVQRWATKQLELLARRLMRKHLIPFPADPTKRAEQIAAFQAELLVESKSIEAKMTEQINAMSIGADDETGQK